MSVRFFSSALLLGILAGLPIAATSTAQSNPAAASFFDGTQSAQTAAGKTPASEARTKIATNYGKLPLSFEANAGQSDNRVKFLAHGQGYGLFLTAQEAVFAFRGAAARRDSIAQKVSRDTVVRMQLRGSNPAAKAEGVQPLPGMANYFVGKDPSRWHTDIPTYSKVRLSSVYPGIDLVYYGNQSQLEYDFVVAPKFDAKTIKLHFAGAGKLALSANGDLSISSRDGQMAFHKPVVYQEVGGQRQPVEGRFTLLADRLVGFSLGRYDHSQPLVIDPVLAYSTYLGGNGFDQGNGIAVDGSGNAYVVGNTSSPNFPVTPGVFQTSSGSAFVTKINATGTALVYSTFLGDPASANGIAVDSNGNAYIAGQTGSSYSTPFPVTPGAFQTVDKNGFNCAFVTKLNPTGDALIYSTYLGGSQGHGDGANAIAIDGDGNAYVAGEDFSSNFPVTPGAFQTIQRSNGQIGFVTKLNSTGSALVYSTFLGGSIYQVITGIALDGAGDAYVTGATQSVNFPVTHGAFQTQNRSIANQGWGATNAFVTKLNPAGTALLYSTYLGGSGTHYGSDRGNGIAVDSMGDAYVAGIAGSRDFPVTPGALQTTNNASAFSSGTGFTTEMNPTGTALVYSTYLGGSGWTDSANAVAVDSSGNAYVAGATFSADFPVTPGAFEPVIESGPAAFVSKFNATGSALLYSTYLGGTGGDSASALALDDAGNAYLTGYAGSYDFPVTQGAFQSGKSTLYYNAFVAKLDLGSPVTTGATATKLSSNSNSQVAGQQVTFTAKVVGSAASSSPAGNVVFALSPILYGNVHGNLASIATVPLNSSGIASYSPSPSLLGLGEWGLNATYLGGGDFGPSTTSLLQHIVSQQAPTFSPAPGQYAGSVQVMLSDTVPNSTIHYTTDGSYPSAASPLYGGPFTIPSGYVTVRAVAFVGSNAASDMSQGSYSIVPQTPTPVISPGSGSYTAGQLITITDATPGATIRYTTDGSAPTAKSTFYSGPFTLTGTEIINAIAISTHDATSDVATASFTVQ